MAGDEYLTWHPLIADFVIVAKKLEELRFIFNKGEVIVLDESLTQSETL